MIEVKNIDSLRIHIRNLEFAQKEHEIFLKEKITVIKDKLAAPIKLYQRITGMFTGKANANKSTNNLSQKPDWVNLVARVGVPFVLNKLVFNKAGFVAKTLISLFSQGAITSVNKNNVVHWVDAVTKFVKSKTKKNKVIDYGIPADSEAY